MKTVGQVREEIGWIVPEIEDIYIPVLGVLPPDIVYPSVPTDELPVIDDDPPSINPPSLPNLPELAFPDEPLLRDIDIPNAVSLTEIPFEGNMPEPTLEEPELTFSFVEAPYNSDLADAIKERLLYWVENGGTGLAEEVETALWVRALDRNLEENEKQYDEALRFWATRGHEEPPGALRGRIRQVNNQIARANQNLNYEIMITQAKLAQENTHFTLEKSVAYEAILMDYFGKMNDRALKAAEAEILAAIQIFNARVAYYNMQLDAYKTSVVVYEAMIRAEMAKVETYKIQMEGAKIGQEIEALKVSMYSTQIQAVLSLVEVYKAQLEGAKLEVEIGKAQLDAYRAMLESKVVQIQAVTAKYNLYQAQLVGEKTKVDLYASQVAAYAKEVDAANVKANIAISEANMLIENNKSGVEIYAQIIKELEANYGVEAAANKALVDEAGVAANIYSSDVNYQKSVIEATLAQMKLRLDTAIAELKHQTDVASMNLQAAVANRDGNLDANKAIAQVTGQMAASSISSVSANATLAFREDRGQSWSHGFSSSINRTDSARNSYEESVSASQV
jgi:hypothetical protein